MFITFIIFYFVLITNLIGCESAFYSDENESEEWDPPLRWFPRSPGQKVESEELETKPVVDCDDGKTSIGIDFDPNDKRLSYNYVCYENRAKFSPNLAKEPLLVEHMVPAMYVPPIKCLNESINIVDEIPTFGAFRPLAPKYGSYSYLPPQRWLHSLAEGAIVLLYHPCANFAQVKLLQDTLRSCLYRHIITPYTALSAERPLALLAWGKCLQISVVDKNIIINFIKENAKHGPLLKADYAKVNNSYEAGLMSAAHLITDLQDVEVCGFNNPM